MSGDGHVKKWKGRPRNHRQTNVPSILMKFLEKVTKQLINAHFRNNATMISSQHYCLQNKPHQANLLPLLKWIIPAPHCETICLYFSKAFNIVLCEILISKLVKHGLDGLTVDTQAT